jgi:VIT1/CCC1 family predicted Fe2+/Mn2+ transporter
MPDIPPNHPERVLDPIARVSEILFGLIMALTFTGTLGAATAGREEVRTLLVGAIGCNIAWGLVDAVMFLMSSLTERGRGLLTIHAVHSATSAHEAHGVIARALPPVLADILKTEDLESMRQGVLGMRDLPPRRLGKEDWLGALAVFLLVVLSTFPVVIPFLVFQNVQLALRTSNLIAIVLMFVCGTWLGRHGGYSQWRTGISVVSLGVLLVGIAIALGG